MRKSVESWDDDTSWEFLDLNNSGSIEVDWAFNSNDFDNEALNITADAKNFTGMMLNIAGNALGGEYRVHYNVSYRYNTFVPVTWDQDGNDAPNTFLGLNVNQYDSGTPATYGDMWTGNSALGDWNWYYWVPWDANTNTFPADIRDVVAPLGYDGAPGWAAETNARDGIDNNGNWLRFGPDGKPGVAGFDDDGNGIVDDLSEVGYGDDHAKGVLTGYSDGTAPCVDWDGPFEDFNGDGDYTYDPEPFVDEGNPFNDNAWANIEVTHPWLGADNIFQSPDDNGNWRPNEEVIYGTVVPATNDLDRGLLFPADTYYQVAGDLEYESGEYIMVDQNANGQIDPTDWCLFPLWDWNTYPGTPLPMRYQTPGTAIPNNVLFHDENANGMYDFGEAVFVDANSNGQFDTGETFWINNVACVDGTAGLVFTTTYPGAVFHDRNGNGRMDSNEAAWQDGNANNLYDNGEAVILGTRNISPGDAATPFPAGAAFYNGNDANPAHFNWRFESTNHIWINSVGNTAATSPDHSPTVEEPQCFLDLMDRDGDGFAEAGDRNVDEIWEIDWENTDDGQPLSNLRFHKLPYYYEPDDGDVWSEGAQFNDWQAIRDDGMSDPSFFTTILPDGSTTQEGEGYFSDSPDNEDQDMWFDADPLMDPYNVSI
ncbi:MAG TPA: hypothetical protein ENN76_02330, partial [Euryarchaeota archaeon]|nr:hypothetical protein [Euryarchaeota archaeon]